MLIKHPRIRHLPWSHPSRDDLKDFDLENFKNKDVVVTLKLDGENTTMYKDYIHARSLDSMHHPSRSWVKKLHSEIGFEIPLGWRFCGENLYAKHTIHYKNLKSYFFIHSIWDENVCLGWDKVELWAEIFSLETVPVLYSGRFDEGKIKSLYQKDYESNKMEGYVVRLSGEFSYENYDKCVAKYVHDSFIIEDDHWMNKEIVLNHLKE